MQLLETIFSKPGRYRRYALCVTTITFGYLITGFAAVKFIFLGEVTGFSIGAIVGLIIGGCVFTALHIRSMRQLDRTRGDDGKP